MSEIPFDGRTAVVTGASGGIGAAVATRLARLGARVAAWDVSSAALDPLTADRVLPVECDVASESSVDAALDLTCSRLGAPTLVVTAAGVIEIHPFLDLPAKQWRRTLDINLAGTFLTIQRCARPMVEERQRGAMVCVASVAARGPRSDCADYAASKAGVVSLVRSAAVALASRGITVNAVCPGVVDTEMTRRNARSRAGVHGVSEAEAIKHLVQQVPLGRMQTRDDVADVVEFLLSDRASYITGQAINACGGLEFD